MQNNTTGHNPLVAKSLRLWVVLSAQSRHSEACAHLFYSYFLGWKDPSRGQVGSEIEQDKQSKTEGCWDHGELERAALLKAGPVAGGSGVLVEW